MSYSDFQNSPVSEKITLAVLQASKRLMGWSLHSGDVYKITIDIPVIVSLKADQDNYQEVSSIDSIVESSYYHDENNNTIYLKTSDSTHPNGKFIYVIRKWFFSNTPLTLPHDLNTGGEVYWEPMIKSTSQFGVEIDTVNQQNEAIEGSGSLVLYNDQDFWIDIFDKWVFDNQICQIYSWNRELEPSDAKKLFDGKVESKDYSATKITFKMGDKLAELKGTIPLDSISSLNLDNDSSLDQAKQRMIFGRLQGFVPINVDVLKDGEFEIDGTVSITNGSDTVSGTGTSFKSQLVPEDVLVINGDEYTIGSISSDTSLSLTDIVDDATVSGVTAKLSPKNPKRYKNRIWKLAGHTLRQPSITVQNGSSTSLLVLSSTKDLYDGDTIYLGTLGSGELTIINEVINDTVVTLSTSLSIIPPIDTVVHRPCVQKAKMDNIELQYYRDYLVDPDNATLTIRDNAEVNAAPTSESVESATFTNGSDIVTGSGTSFKSYLKAGDVIRPKGTADWYQILSVDSDTQIQLIEDYSDINKTDNVQYKSYVFSNNESVLNCEVLGRTYDGTSTGELLKTAPNIVKSLLTDANLSDYIDTDSFNGAVDYFTEELAFSIPENYDDDSSTTYKEVINKVNKSVFGLLIQNSDFKFNYELLQPVINSDYRLFTEADILDIKVKQTNKNMIKTSYVKFNRKEYNSEVKDELITTVSNTSDTATYLLKTNNTKTYDSYLVSEEDAQRLSKRWLFLLETSTSQVTFKTKMQAADLNVNDIICIHHRKMYKRFSGTSSRKYLAIESIQKSGDGVTITAVDLSNAFNRIALITDNIKNYSESSEDTRALAGFITDQYGLIDNEPETFNTNLIW